MGLVIRPWIHIRLLIRCRKIVIYSIRACIIEDIRQNIAVCFCDNVPQIIIAIGIVAVD